MSLFVPNVRPPVIILTDTPAPMATRIASNGTTPTSNVSTPSSTGTKSQFGGQNGDRRTVVVVFNPEHDNIVHTVADVLGRSWRMARCFADVVEGEAAVVGIRAQDAKEDLNHHLTSHMVIVNTHCMDSGAPPDSGLSSGCDYEFLYTQKPFYRRDLARFLSVILGQSTFHEDVIRRERSYHISTTFPDVRTGLSNLDILTVGADAVEFRVDLLKDSRLHGSNSAVPSLKYVGEQIMVLRQSTELPIIFTIRCTNENGKFPMDDPNLNYEYLYRAIQWGVEYIDVELWLPEGIRSTLAEKKGNSKIISAFHDFSGNWKWPSPEAQRVFEQSVKYADIVKMIVMIQTMPENYQLEYFRSTIKATYPVPPLLAVNMGPMGRLSRALNTFLSPITHPQLPMIAAPGQVSMAEINETLHTIDELPKRDIYAIGSSRSSPQAMFFEKCFNELGLPHHFACIERGPSVEGLVMQPKFGGAYLNPPLPTPQCSFIPSLTDAARAIGSIDTIVVRHEGGQHDLVGDNATWKGIRATLTRDFVPSAYQGRPALVLSNTEVEAAPAIFALRDLNIGTIYTVGFRAQGPLASGLEPFTTMDSVKKGEQPFVIISALPPDKSLLVSPLLRHYGAKGVNGRPPSKNGAKVFIDMAPSSRKGDPIAVAANSGWRAYGPADVRAWTTVETFRLLVGQNVPFDFVSMASGRGLC